MSITASDNCLVPTCPAKSLAKSSGKQVMLSVMEKAQDGCADMLVDADLQLCFRNTNARLGCC